ncbi:hypothetical protein ACTFIZ_003240 [Dictyostelium cf. discoideum]
METINYFKIENLINKIITDRLFIILKDKWKNETSLEWKTFNNKEIFLYMTEHYPQLTTIFKKKPVLSVSDGDFVNFYTFNHFYIFLKHLKSNKDETKLNPILEIINEIDKKQDKETLLKSNDEYNEIIEKLKYCLNKLDLIVNEINVVDIDIESMGINVGCNYEDDEDNEDEDDESKLFDKDNEFKLIKINRDNEIKSIKLKEKGNKDFIGKNYDSALNKFLDALKLDQLSNQTKSILSLNASTASFELNLHHADQQANGNFISDHHDFDSIKSAEIYATIAIQFRPVWGKSYFRLAKIKSRLSNYQHAIQLCEAAFHLESLQSSKLEIEKLKQSCSQKLKMIQDSSIITTSETTEIKRSGYSTIKTTITKTTSTRNFEMETKVRIQDLGNLVYEKFKNFKLTKNTLHKYGIYYEEEDRKFLPLCKKWGFSNDRLWEMDALEFSFGQMKNGIYKGAIELIKATIGNGTDYFEAYTGYSDLFRKRFYSDCGFKLVDSNGDNRPLVVSLLLHASTLNHFIKVERLNLISINENRYSKEEYDISMALANYQASSLFRAIAIIYRHGLLGEDIDSEKYQWYINKSIDYDNKTHTNTSEVFKTKGLGSLALGWDHFKGFLSIGKDKVKAKEAWIQGVKNGDNDSFHCLTLYFTKDKDFRNLVNNLNI